MNFAQFCAAHGLIIRSLAITAPGVTKRCATTCNTKKENGWYRWDGLGGVCGIWGSLDAQQYRPGAEAKPLSKADFEAIAARAKQAADLERKKHADAARRAVALLARSESRSHAYLARKGFAELLAPTLNDGAMLLVTMWKAGRVVNLQRINAEGEKRFLAGGECTGANHTIGNVGTPINCEGFATALSVAAAIKASKMRAHCVCWFTAGNMAAHARTGVVVADNDALKTSTGEKAAKETGLRYWMPPTPGHDFNDYARAAGLFQASQRIRELLLTK